MPTDQEKDLIRITSAQVLEIGPVRVLLSGHGGQAHITINGNGFIISPRHARALGGAIMMFYKQECTKDDPLGIQARGDYPGEC